MYLTELGTQVHLYNRASLLFEQDSGRFSKPSHSHENSTGSPRINFAFVFSSWQRWLPNKSTSFPAVYSQLQPLPSSFTWNTIIRGCAPRFSCKSPGPVIDDGAEAFKAAFPVRKVKVSKGGKDFLSKELTSLTGKRRNLSRPCSQTISLALKGWSISRHLMVGNSIKRRPLWTYRWRTMSWFSLLQGFGPSKK